MQLSRRVSWLILVIIVVLQVCSFLLISSNEQLFSQKAPLSSDYPSDKDILNNLYSNPLRFFLFEIFTLAILCGVFLGLILDAAFIIRTLKAKTLGFNKDFIHADLSVSDFISSLLLITLFFSIFKFTQLSFIRVFGLENVTFALILNGLFEIFSILALVFLAGMKRFSTGLKPLAIGAAGIRMYLGIAPLVILALFFNIFIFKYFGFEPEPMPAVALLLKENNLFNLVIFFLEGVILAPLFEEIFFRGMVYGFLRKRFSVGFSAVVSALFFSLLHNNLFSFLPIFILGIAFASLYERTKTIVAPILLHSFHNFLVMGLLFLVKP